MRRYWKRILMTVLLVTLGYLAFSVPPDPETLTQSLTSTTTVTTVRDRGHKFFEWVGVLCLALAVWPWRDILKLTSIGLLGGQPLEQQTPEEFEKSAAESSDQERSPTTFDEATAQAKQLEFAEAKKYVIEYIAKHHALNEAALSHRLGISSSFVRVLLSSLVAEGVLRRDGFPRHTLYTSATSLENRAIDYVRDHHIAPHYRLLSERRFVRVGGGHEIDAVFDCDERTFLIEVKFVTTSAARGQIEAAQKRLADAASSFARPRLAGFVVLVAQERNRYNGFKELADRMTFDTAELSIRSLVISADELAPGGT